MPDEDGEWKRLIERGRQPERRRMSGTSRVNGRLLSSFSSFALLPSVFFFYIKAALILYRSNFRSAIQIYRNVPFVIMFLCAKLNLVNSTSFHFHLIYTCILSIFLFNRKTKHKLSRKLEENGKGMKYKVTIVLQD